MTKSDVPGADLVEQSLPPRARDEPEIIEEIDSIIESDALVDETDA